MKHSLLESQEIKQLIEAEIKSFCGKLLSFSNPEPDNADVSPSKVAEKKQPNIKEQFFLKIIEYIGESNESNKGDGKIIKWLLFCFAKMFKLNKPEDNEDESEAMESLIVNFAISLML